MVWSETQHTVKCVFVCVFSDGIEFNTKIGSAVCAMSQFAQSWEPSVPGIGWYPEGGFGLHVQKRENGTVTMLWPTVLTD